MLHQSWLVWRDIRLLRVHHTPAAPYPAGGAVLLAGLSHPMCDVDYFMSRLARQLVKNGLFVAQVDLRGHGDSSGNFSDVDLDTLREDISFIVSHYTQRFPPEDLLFVGRGLSATLLAERCSGGHFRGVAGVAPYRLSPQVVRSHLDELTPRSNDAFEFFPGNDYVAFSDFSKTTLCMLEALGAVPYNLHGMQMSRRMLKQLAELDANAVLQPNAKGTRDLMVDSFLRQPAFQQSVIAQLSEWTLDRYLLH